LREQVTAKPIIPREMALRDIDDAISHYLSENAEQAALDFIDQLEQSYSHISKYPATGSPRYAHELNLPSLQFWLVKKHSHLIFYIEHPEHIDVWRVLHGERDIPVLMQENTESLMASDQRQRKA
jgi:toxin ParE1/3/4